MILTEMVFPEMSFADLSPLANHLWQSTLCATAISFLTLVLRKNRAAVRYWLWLAASVKFLVPFSLLVSMGSQLQFGWRNRSGCRAATSVVFHSREYWPSLFPFRLRHFRPPHRRLRT